MLLFGTGPADQAVLEALYGAGSPAVVATARTLTFIGASPVGIPLVLLGILLICHVRGRSAAIADLAVTGVGRLLVEVQKYGIDRARPQLEPHLAVVSSPSFPSGHAANSMIACLTFAILMFEGTRWQRSAVAVAILLSLAIGLSRPVLGVHWPSDVVGGWVFGILWVAAILPLAQRSSITYFGSRQRGG